MKSKHVLMVCSEYPPRLGGIGYFVQQLGRKLQQQGMHVSVITRGHSFRVRKTIDHGISIYYLPCFIPSPLGLIFHGLLTKRLIRSIKPDILHLHSPLVSPIPSSIPNIITVHSVCTPMVNGLYPLNGHAETWYRHVMLPFYKAIEKRCLDSATTVVCMTKASRQELPELRDVNLVQIPNGCKADLFQHKTRKKRILFVGRMITGKGILDLIKAIHLISRDGWEFLFIGNGKQLNTAKAMARKQRLRSLTFVAHVDHTKIADYFNTSEILVLPSYYETMPNVLLEAMSCKMAIVASRLQGNTEFLKDKKNAILITPGNVKELAEAIRLLMDDSELRKKMGEANRAMIRGKYNLDKMTNDYIRAYEEILER
jgi:glycosyltransferase involved in cell wall biosynthesis